jgi:hypothetical protein
LCEDPSELYQNKSIIKMKILPPINVTEGPVLPLTVIFSDFQNSVQFLSVQYNSSGHISRGKFVFATPFISQIYFVLTFFLCWLFLGHLCRKIAFSGEVQLM